MAVSESTKALSLWPKLVLWGMVIVVGFLYLGSVERKRGAEAAERVTVPVAIAPTAVDTPASEAAAATQSHAETSGAEEGPAQVGGERETVANAPSEPGSSAVETPGTVPRPSEESRGEAPPTIAEGPPAPTEVVVLAQVNTEGRANEPTAETRPPSGGHEGPATVAAKAPSDAAPESPDDLDAVSPAEAQAFAKAVISEPEEPQPAQAAEPAAGTGTPAAPAVPTTTHAPAPAVQDTLEQRRARIMAEYRVMQQRAQEEMRRRWTPRRIPVVPYGYPAYPPAYYPPQRWP